jgi:transcriptional regulator with XRE-family HTH domain
MDKPLTKHFGGGLKKLRKSRKLTQEGLAETCSLTPSYISILERNLKSPSLNTISALAAGLDMKPSEFIREIEEFRAS